MKYVVVIGSTVSGIGKGITSSSIGVLLQNHGLAVTAIKIDPYWNTDAGLLSPSEHGECFILDDGSEVDLDNGSYQRFLGISMTKKHNVNSAKIHGLVMQKEREGKEYLGQTVQTVPHITDAIQKWIGDAALKPVQAELDGKAPDVCLIEVGGSIGDLENAVFIEALRQMKAALLPTDFCVVQVALLPTVGLSTEQKTKPTQHGIRDLRAAGLTPDFICCRSDLELQPAAKQKIAQYAMIDAHHVISVHNTTNLYRVPPLLYKQSMDLSLLKRLNLPISMAAASDRLTSWFRWSALYDDQTLPVVNIAIVGKYIKSTDAYLSVIHALRHACMSEKKQLQISWIDAESFVPDPTWHGILVPGGFGSRGVEGMISAASYARKHKIPYLGLCLGFQVAVIAFARDQLGWKDANSDEFIKTPPFTITKSKLTKEMIDVYMNGFQSEKQFKDFMESKEVQGPASLIIQMLETKEGAEEKLGGTMRLGLRQTNLKPKSMASLLYQSDKCFERHRHRYEVNPVMIPYFETDGMIFSGLAEPMHRSDTCVRAEIVELSTTEHPFYFATQFHPEFKSRPNQPSPPFVGFVAAAAREISLDNGGKQAVAPTKAS